VLQRLDMVFSRDQSERFYVQHRLLQSADTLRAMAAQRRGRLRVRQPPGHGVGRGCHLAQMAGEALWSELSTTGRYRRDVY
jgi:sulfite reductase (NADPH) flavoprotein alpha-component